MFNLSDRCQCVISKGLLLLAHYLCALLKLDNLFYPLLTFLDSSLVRGEFGHFNELALAVHFPRFKEITISLPQP